MLIPAEISGVTLLVEAVPVPGSEPTSRHDSTGRVQDMFYRAQEVIEKIAITTGELRDRLATKSRAPDQIELQFGISFATQGQIVIAGASAQASLSVKITYHGETKTNGQD